MARKTVSMAAPDSGIDTLTTVEIRKDERAAQSMPADRKAREVVAAYAAEELAGSVWAASKTGGYVEPAGALGWSISA